MAKLVTRDYVNQVQFFQMPKTFFVDPRYVGMRSDSKLAYMFMLDLLPLSIENNWVNRNGEVFVKLSRDKLMGLLNIRGTQKAAIIMKELVSCGLILIKKIGLNKCNEIYLYLLDEQPRKLTPKATKPVKLAVAAPHPLAQTTQDAPVALVEVPTKAPVSIEMVPATPVFTTPTSQSLVAAKEEVQHILTNVIHLEDLKQQYDPKLVDEIGLNIQEMFLSTSTSIGQQDKPMMIIQDTIRLLEMHHIEHVINQFIQVCAQTQIVNLKKYLQTMIYNAAYETNAKVFSHIRYHFGYY